jgi:DNA-binding GntR family transcriptional regulator
MSEFVFEVVEVLPPESALMELLDANPACQQFVHEAGGKFDRHVTAPGMSMQCRVEISAASLWVERALAVPLSGLIALKVRRRHDARQPANVIIFVCRHDLAAVE